MRASNKRKQLTNKLTNTLGYAYYQHIVEGSNKYINKVSFKKVTYRN